MVGPLDQTHASPSYVSQTLLEDSQVFGYTAVPMTLTARAGVLVFSAQYQLFLLGLSLSGMCGTWLEC